MTPFHQYTKSLRVLVVLTLSLLSTIADAQTWQPVRGGIANNISGLANVSQADKTSRFLVVHDNKLPTESRAALVETSPDGESRFTALIWANVESLPIDLEAVCAIPQKASEFLALSSSGAGFHIALDESAKTVRVLNTFALPQIPAGANFESFDVKQIGGALVAFWATRGQDATAATLFWARLNLRALTFSDVQNAPITAPIASANAATNSAANSASSATSSTRSSANSTVGELRHASDLRVDNSGVLYVSSASDAGDDGPFSSSVFIAGTFFRVGNAISFEQNAAPVVLRRFRYHKVEALELLPNAGGIVVGTDDENLGSSVCFVAE